MNEQLEQEIQAKGLTAPRITPQHIESLIVHESYFTAADGLFGATGVRVDALSALNRLTICVLVLKNGYTVTGESACASPENFNSEVGCKAARAHAVEKIWALEGYLLRDHLHLMSSLGRAEQPPCDNDHVAPGCEQFTQ